MKIQVITGLSLILTTGFALINEISWCIHQENCSIPWILAFSIVMFIGIMIIELFEND